MMVMMMTMMIQTMVMVATLLVPLYYGQTNRLVYIPLHSFHVTDDDSIII
jgi:hypothetical protein